MSGTEENAPGAGAAPVAEAFPGYPLVRFNPVHGRAEFISPNDYARAGGDEGDWRFRSAFDADRARTGAEAELVRLHNLQQQLEAEKATSPVVRNSVQAEASRAAGYPEPGLS